MKTLEFSGDNLSFDNQTFDDNYGGQEFNNIFIVGECKSIKFQNCIFHCDVWVSLESVENDVEFIECDFVGKARLFFVKGEFKKRVTLSFKALSVLSIKDCKFKEFYLGYWGSGTNVDEIRIDGFENIEGRIIISGVKTYTLFLRGINEKVQLIVEDLKVNLINIYRLTNRSSIRFQNINGFTENAEKEPSQFNIQDSNIGSAEFFLVNFDSFNEVNFRNSFIGNAIFMDCEIDNSIGAKVGRKISNREINTASLAVENANANLKRLEALEQKDENKEREIEEVKNSVLEKKQREQTLIEEDIIKQIRYRKENYKQLKYSFYKTGDKINERRFHGLEMEEYLKTDIPCWDKIILCVSKLSSDFGQSFVKPFLFHGTVHIILCLILFLGFHYNNYGFVSLRNLSWSDFYEAINDGLYLFMPLKGFEKDFLIIDILMKINSGLFLYNVIRASRKFYH